MTKAADFVNMIASCCCRVDRPFYSNEAVAKLIQSDRAAAVGEAMRGLREWLAERHSVASERRRQAASDFLTEIFAAHCHEIAVLISQVDALAKGAK